MILLLCHGNICRSPFAAAIMRAQGVEDVYSAGFKTSGTRSPSKVRDWARVRGLDLDDHKSHEICFEDVRDARIILYMDSGNLARLTAVWENWTGNKELEGIAHKVKALAAYLVPPGVRIGDPMFAGRDTPEFKVIMDQLEVAAINFVNQETVEEEVTEEAAVPVEEPPHG